MGREFWKWCEMKKNKISKPNSAAYKAKSIENLVLMSSWSAIVAANSSFSWRACFIAGDKIVVISPNILTATVNNFENENEPLNPWKFVNVN